MGTVHGEPPRTRRFARHTLKLVVGALIGVLFPLVTPQPASAAYLTRCLEDGSVSVRLCTTIYFNSYRGSDGLTYVAAEKYVLSWTRLSSQPALLRGTANAIVVGRCGYNCTGSIKDQMTLAWSYPSSGHGYTAIPRWAGKYISVKPSAGNYHCVENVLEWSRGTSRYVTRFDTCLS